MTPEAAIKQLMRQLGPEPIPETFNPPAFILAMISAADAQQIWSRLREKLLKAK